MLPKKLKKIFLILGTLFLAFFLFSYAFPVFALSIPFSDNFENYEIGQLHNQYNWTETYPDRFRVKQFESKEVECSTAPALNCEAKKKGEQIESGSWQLEFYLPPLSSGGYFQVYYIDDSNFGWIGWRVQDFGRDDYYVSCQRGCSGIYFEGKINTGWNTFLIVWDKTIKKWFFKLNDESSPTFDLDETFPYISGLKIEAFDLNWRFDNISSGKITGIGGLPFVFPDEPATDTISLVDFASTTFSGTLKIPDIYDEGYCYELNAVLSPPPTWLWEKQPSIQTIPIWQGELEANEEDAYSTTTEITLDYPLLKVDYKIFCHNTTTEQIETFFQDVNSWVESTTTIPSPPLAPYITELPTTTPYLISCDEYTGLDWLVCKIHELLVGAFIPSAQKITNLKQKVDEIGSKFPSNYINTTNNFIYDVYNGLSETQPNLVITAPFSNATSSVDFSLLTLNLGGSLNISLQQLIRGFFTILALFGFGFWLLEFLGSIL